MAGASGLPYALQLHAPDLWAFDTTAFAAVQRRPLSNTCLTRLLHGHLGTVIAISAFALQQGTPVAVNTSVATFPLLLLWQAAVLASTPEGSHIIPIYMQAWRL